MICMHVKRSSAVKYVSLACQKFFNYAPTPTKRERKRREWSSFVYFGWRWKAGNGFLRQGVAKWQPTRLVVLRAYCACHCDSQFVMAGTAPCHICVHHVLHTFVSLARPQSAWHIPLWCALNCSKIFKQFLFLHLLLLLRSCQRICRRVILIFERLIERLGKAWHVYYYFPIFLFKYLSHFALFAQLIWKIHLFIYTWHTHIQSQQTILGKVLSFYCLRLCLNLWAATKLVNFAIPKDTYFMVNK